MNLLLKFLNVILVLYAVAVVPTANLHAETQKERVVIAQFGKEKFLLYLPLYVAIEEGLFSKQGLEVDLRFVGNDDQIFATVISGAASFGVGDPVFAAISREKGGPGKIVAMLVTKLGLSGYTNKATVPDITVPDDAKGLRLGSLPAPSTTYTLLREFVRSNRLDQRKTTIVQAAIGAQLAALEAGQIDVAVDLEPAVSIAESRGYRVNFALDSFTEPQAITGISTLESTIQNRPDLVQKVVTALQEGLTLAHSSPETRVRVAKNLFPNLSESVIHNALKRMYAGDIFPRSVKIEDSFWQRTLKTRLDSGELKRPQTTDFTVDNRFAEKALVADKDA
ncbi:MAG: hypothetical protein RIS36_1856 [Pseudomonadota bacterium]|jgi:NitT/TauT family transport system substrate-binding protein